MIKKPKFKTFYDTIVEKEGTTFTDESLTNQDSEKEVNIHKVIERYGIKALMEKNKPEEEMYIDLNFYEEMDLNSILEYRKKTEEYYNQLPAKIRKEFGDDYNEFWQRYTDGKLDNFVEKGIISEESVAEINRIQKAQKDKYIAELTNQYKLQEIAKIQAQKEMGDTENENNKN